MTRLDIISGPSLQDLMLALFVRNDGGSSRRITFRIQGVDYEDHKDRPGFDKDNTKIEIMAPHFHPVIVTDVSRVGNPPFLQDRPYENWIIRGGTGVSRYEAHYSTQTRKGYIEYED